MGLRFRRSVSLFPGVRLNFSGSGISTTIGRRGASVTLGPRGSHLNLGIPGTGVSSRTELGGPAPRGNNNPRASVSPQPALVPQVPTTPGAYGEAEVFQSGELEAMTSDGLNGLKRLINDASVRRAAL